MDGSNITAKIVGERGFASIIDKRNNVKNVKVLKFASMIGVRPNAKIAKELKSVSTTSINEDVLNVTEETFVIMTRTSTNVKYA